MLRKIDCVMIQVEDLENAVQYYIDVFGMRQLWRDEISVGLGFPDTDAEIVLHSNPTFLPGSKFITLSTMSSRPSKCSRGVAAGFWSSPLIFRSASAR